MVEPVTEAASLMFGYVCSITVQQVGNILRCRRRDHPLGRCPHCSMSTWNDRNCPVAIRAGELKLMKGYVGDPRILSINDTDRPTGGDGAESTPDPNCTRGVVGSAGDTCCAAECGTCGGSDCNKHPGGSKNCCNGAIRRAGIYCDGSAAPCIIGLPPAPAPNGTGVPFGRSGGYCGGAKMNHDPERCSSPGLKGVPKPTAHGTCVDGCLFNLTAGKRKLVAVWC